MRPVAMGAIALMCVLAEGCRFAREPVTERGEFARLPPDTASAFAEAPRTGYYRITYLYPDGPGHRPGKGNYLRAGTPLGFRAVEEGVEAIVGSEVIPLGAFPAGATAICWSGEWTRWRWVTRWDLVDDDEDPASFYWSERLADNEDDAIDDAQVTRAKDRGSRYGDSRNNDPVHRERTRD